MSEPAVAPPSAAEPARPRRRLRWRLLFLVLGVLLALFAVYFVLGTLPRDPADPATPADGPVSRLVRGDDGEKEIRTAVVIPVPVGTAWKILSDYEEWEKLFKTVRKKRVAEPLGDNRHHVVSDVMTPVGEITLDFVVTHEALPGGGYLAWWDAPTAELPVNKGAIRVEPRGGGETLLVYTVRKRYRTYPQFMVNNMLMRQQKDLVRTLAGRMVEVARTP